jgi:N-acetylglucosaminyldiphosphoundecaprenol N-acetyl-beta-D-mannosaminyltransferase
MGMPLQERWLLDNHSRIQARVFMTCGAAFELFSGMLPLCPRWMADSGLNWLFRLFQNPRRLAGRYLMGNTEFLLRILAVRVRSLVKPASGPRTERV